ncbi:MAG TPA: phosphate ABC transporter substrate-binding protein [Clostridiales bacterium]|nr:phosphate ABC transporter substrate-binding protein [Clostridiales bacterium]
MRRTIKGIAALLLMMIFVIGTFTACAGKGSEENKDQNTATETPDTTTDGATDAGTDASEDTSNNTADLSGAITLAGSTSMEKIANAAAEAFMEKYPDVIVTPQFTGSSAGIEALLAGTVDIGNSSRNLKDTEISSGAVENIVAIDGIAVITDKSNAVADLTKDQLVQIFTGAITNWSELGGNSQPIVVIGREAGSGTRGAFEELLEIEDACKYSNEINSTGGVMAKVASTPGAIGYVSLDVVDDSVGAMKLDGVEPTEENIKAGSYLLSRPFVMATKGAIADQKELVQAFLNYMLSAEGQELVKSVGLITVE